jgi:hypothetical protein
MVYAGTEDAHTMTRALLPVPVILALVILGERIDAGGRRGTANGAATT